MDEVPELQAVPTNIATNVLSISPATADASRTESNGKFDLEPGGHEQPLALFILVTRTARPVVPGPPVPVGTTVVELRRLLGQRLGHDVLLWGGADGKLFRDVGDRLSSPIFAIPAHRDVRLGCELGSGSYGTVFAASSGGHVMAVKQLRRDAPGELPPDMAQFLSLLHKSYDPASREVRCPPSLLPATGVRVLWRRQVLQTVMPCGAMSGCKALAGPRRLVQILRIMRAQLEAELAFNALGLTHQDHKAGNVVYVDGKPFVCDVDSLMPFGSDRILATYPAPENCNGAARSASPASALFAIGCSAARALVSTRQIRPGTMAQHTLADYRQRVCRQAQLDYGPVAGPIVAGLLEGLLSWHPKEREAVVTPALCDWLQHVADHMAEAPPQGEAAASVRAEADNDNSDRVDMDLETAEEHDPSNFVKAAASAAVDGEEEGGDMTDGDEHSMAQDEEASNDDISMAAAI